MPPFEKIALLLIAYIALAVLLLSLNIVSRWRWWVKAGAMAVTGVFFIGSYPAMRSLLGWPTTDRLPERFSLIASRIVEPNRDLGQSGSVFLWVESLNEDNIPSGKPISYRLTYSDALADTTSDAQEILDKGGEVEGTRSETEEKPKDQNGLENAGPELSPIMGGGAGAGDTEGYEGSQLMFNNLPPVRLPDKGPL